MDNKPRDYQAYVTIVDGKTVLIDPIGYAVIQAVNKSNCENTYLSQADRIQHFKNRINEKMLDSRDFVINVINVDSPYGCEIAEILMPGHDWQQYRDKGETPYARGLATKEVMIKLISSFDQEAADKIIQMEQIPVIIIDYGVVEIFSV